MRNGCLWIVCTALVCKCHMRHAKPCSVFSTCCGGRAQCSCTVNSLPPSPPPGPVMLWASRSVNLYKRQLPSVYLHLRARARAREWLARNVNACFQTQHTRTRPVCFLHPFQPPPPPRRWCSSRDAGLESVREARSSSGAACSTRTRSASHGQRPGRQLRAAWL